MCGLRRAGSAALAQHDQQPNRRRVSYTYAASGNKGVGRLTGETFTGGACSPLSGSYSYTYDSRGRAISTTTTVNGTPYTVSKTYDSAGNKLTQTYPTGEVVASNFGSTAWLDNVTTNLGGPTTVLAGSNSYSGNAGAAGQITSMQLGNNTYTYAASYDDVHRLTNGSLTRVSDGVVLFATAPSFDAVSNVTAVATTCQREPTIRPSATMIRVASSGRVQPEPPVVARA